jgi:hypothetical protein
MAASKTDLFSRVDESLVLIPEPFATRSLCERRPPPHNAQLYEEMAHAGQNYFFWFKRASFEGGSDFDSPTVTFWSRRAAAAVSTHRKSDVASGA